MAANSSKRKSSSTSKRSTRGSGSKLTAGQAAKKKAAAKAAPAKKAPAKKTPVVEQKPRFWRSWWKKAAFWRWAGSTFFTLCFLGIAAILYFAHDLPSISGLETIHKQPGVTMKTADGLTLASYGDVYGDYIEYDQIPRHLIDAVLATEDRRFFDHWGIDPWGIARAMVVNVKAGRFVQGGSTLTQQVAKNIFLTPDRTLKRKIQEMMLAFWLEGRFSKQQILAIYLNRVYLGAGNYGVDAAARRYFDKPAREVNVMEGAILTGLLKAPSRYSPIANPDLAKKRAHQVLLNMVAAGYLRDDEVERALATFESPELYREGDASGTRYFTDWVMDELPQYMGPDAQEDVVVVTTIDPVLQKEAEDAVNEVLAELGEEKNASQAALVVMSPDGAIQAMVGGKSYKASQFNRATQAKRQPGSVFKLFVYLAALDAGMSPDTILVDEPLEIPTGRKIWRPKNFGGKYRGEITMKEGLTHSINTIAVQLAMLVGVDRVVDMARRLGIQDVPPTPSIALGSVEADLLSLTAAYAHLANEGRGVQPYGVQTVLSQGGDAIYRRQGSGLWVVLRNHVVQQMNNMLMNVPLEGTGRRAYIGRPMAGKTGTSSDYRDAWFVGFTPQLVAGVWVGNDDNSQMKKVTGGNMPAMIWNRFMSKALAGKAAPMLPSAIDYAPDEGALPWQNGESAPTKDPLGSFMDRLGLGDAEEAAPPVRVPAPSSATPKQPSADRLTEDEESFWDRLVDEEADSNSPRFPVSSERERRLSR